LFPHGHSMCGELVPSSLLHIRGITTFWPQLTTFPSGLRPYLYEKWRQTTSSTSWSDILYIVLGFRGVLHPTMLRRSHPLRCKGSSQSITLREIIPRDIILKLMDLLRRSIRPLEKYLKRP
jgi:hypothetical protein